MTGLTKGELAERAGTTVDQVGRMADLGLVSVREDGQTFRAEDVQLVRLLEACRQSGIPLDGVARAVETGHLSLAFTSMSWVQSWAAYSGMTYETFCRELGMSLELLQRLHEFMGFPRPTADDPIRDDDARTFPVMLAMQGVGISEAVLTRASRVYGENLRRVAQEGTRLFHSEVEMPLMSSGMSEPQMRVLAGQIGDQLQPLTEQIIMWLYRRYQEHYIVEDLIEHIESAMERAGVARARVETPPAMVFLDLVGYTRLTEEQGDEAAAELAASLAELVQAEAQRFRGRPVKWLGDGVMFHFPAPADSVRCALELVERAPAAGMPPAHVGVNAGPVVFRDGDYFGRTVNVAARIAAQAGPGEVMVSRDVVEHASPEGIGYQEVGPRELKGVAAPVMLYRAIRVPT